MKNFLIQESAFSATPTISKKNEKTVEFIAVLQEADKPNRNGRVYYRKVLEEALNAPYIQERIRTNSLYGEAGHPMDTSVQRQMTIDQRNIAFLIKEFWWEGNLLKGRIETADTVIGRDMKGLIEQGSRVAFSLRAQGNVHYDPTIKATVVQSPIQIATYDWVVNPSHDKAFLESILEETRTCLMGKKCDGRNQLILTEATNLFEQGQLIEVNKNEEVRVMDYAKNYHRKVKPLSEAYVYEEGDQLADAGKIATVVNEGETKKVVLEDFLLKDLRHRIARLTEEEVVEEQPEEEVKEFEVEVVSQDGEEVEVEVEASDVEEASEKVQDMLDVEAEDIKEVEEKEESEEEKEESEEVESEEEKEESEEQPEEEKEESEEQPEEEKEESEEVESEELQEEVEMEEQPSEESELDMEEVESEEEVEEKLDEIEEKLEEEQPEELQEEAEIEEQPEEVVEVEAEQVAEELGEVEAEIEEVKTEAEQVAEENEIAAEEAEEAIEKAEGEEVVEPEHSEESDEEVAEEQPEELQESEEPSEPAEQQYEVEVEIAPSDAPEPKVEAEVEGEELVVQDHDHADEEGQEVRDALHEGEGHQEDQELDHEGELVDVEDKVLPEIKDGVVEVPEHDHADEEGQEVRDALHEEEVPAPEQPEVADEQPEVHTPEASNDDVMEQPEVEVEKEGGEPTDEVVAAVEVEKEEVIGDEQVAEEIQEVVTEGLKPLRIRRG